jgi:hypothetical protein
MHFTYGGRVTAGRLLVRSQEREHRAILSRKKLTCDDGFIFFSVKRILKDDFVTGLTGVRL